MSDLSKQVLNIAVSYLGPAAERFLERQCSAHLNTSFENLSAGEIPELGRWITISAGLVIGKDKAEEFSNKVLALK
ncbi:MAG: hypothetical protein KGZ93_10165 [Actinobacteria bacterium]|nr:hypothetical protein [Actinomycetota bacterium]